MGPVPQRDEFKAVVLCGKGPGARSGTGPRQRSGGFHQSRRGPRRVRRSPVSSGRLPHPFGGPYAGAGGSGRWSEIGAPSRFLTGRSAGRGLCPTSAAAVLTRIAPVLFQKHNQAAPKEEPGNRIAEFLIGCGEKDPGNGEGNPRLNFPQGVSVLQTRFP
jgi:hypothetical protein